MQYPDSGANGGDATATSNVSSTAGQTGDTVDAEALAFGGDGGDVDSVNGGAAASAGAGGSGSATASARTNRALVATASAFDEGGAGGNGIGGTPGGAGGASTATNAVGGYTNGGELELTEQAVGGAGGTDAGNDQFYIGGAGGAATATLNDNDQRNAFQSATVIGEATANGGAGGSGGAGGNGGNAQATVTIKSAPAAQAGALADAVGGAAGLGVVSDGFAGAANAAADAVGANFVSEAIATGGDGAAAGANADAKAAGSGGSGFLVAEATTGASGGGATAAVPTVLGIDAQAHATVDSAALATALAGYSSDAPTFLAGYASAADATASPFGAQLDGILANNPNIVNGFGEEPSYYAAAELEGFHSNTGTSAEQDTATFSVTLNRAAIAANQAIDLGFYNPTTNGTGVTGVTIDIFADGNLVSGKSFSGAAGAAAYASDKFVSLGAIDTLGGSSSTLDLEVRLTVHSNTAGSGFGFGVLLGG